jgi:hypothetical protein
MGVNDTPILLPRVSILQVHDETVRVTRVCCKVLAVTASFLYYTTLTG